MHPAYKSDKPGIAPDCGMKLEPVYADGGAAAAPAAANRKVLYYRDPKDPNYKAQQPGLNPETGSELEPVYADDISTMEVGTVQITPEKQQLIGVKYEQVEVGGGSRTIRAVGKVAIDETRIGHVHTKVEGWIDKVFVDFTGKLVEKGQPLLTIYSPDMLASQRELLLAAKAKTIMRNSALPSGFRSERILASGNSPTLGIVGSQRSADRPGSQDRRADQEHHRVLAHDGVRHRAQGVPASESHARHGPVHDRGSQPRLDHGGRVRVRSPEHPRGPDGPCISPGNSRKGLQRADRFSPAAGRSDDPNSQGAAQYGQPRRAAQAGHVRRCRIPGEHSGETHGAGGRSAQRRRTQDGLYRSRQRLLRAEAGEDRRARG